MPRRTKNRKKSGELSGDAEGSDAVELEAVTDDEAVDDQEGVDVEAGGREVKTRDELYEAVNAVDDPDVEDEQDPGEEAEASDGGADSHEEPEARTDGADEAAESEESEFVFEEEEEEATASTDTHEDPVALLKQNATWPDEEWKKLPPATRDRITAIRGAAQDIARQAKTQEEELKPAADYGNAIVKFTERAGLSDDQFHGWLERGELVAKGGQPAIDCLLGMAKALGYQEPTAAAASAGAPPLPQYLADMVQRLEITEEQARDIAANLGKEQEPQKPATVAPPKANIDPVREATQALNDRITSASAKYSPSDWAKIMPRVEREMLKHRDSVDPQYWPVLFDQSLAVVVARATRKKPRSAGTPTLGAQGGQRERTNPDDLTGRDRIYAMIRR